MTDQTYAKVSREKKLSRDRHQKSQQEKYAALRLRRKIISAGRFVDPDDLAYDGTLH